VVTVPFLHPLSLGALVGALSALGCAGESRSQEEGERSALINGFDVRDPRADAVGTIGRIYAPDTFDPTCTATLIARDQVLTAKHCVEASTAEAPYVSDREIGFALGFDSRAPRRVVKVASVRVYEPDEGGYIHFGRDVAIYTLSEPIDDVAPLHVATEPIGASDVGGSFWAVGYGAQDYEHATRGTRRAGRVTLRAIRGSPMHALFADRDAFRSVLRHTEGDAWVAEQAPALDAFFDYELLGGYEIYVGLREAERNQAERSQGEAQPCDGDSGGPLVRQRGEGGAGDDFEVVAVVSGSRKGARNRCSVLGEFYANVDVGSLR
jgi:hypothetical protein